MHEKFCRNTRSADSYPQDSYISFYIHLVKTLFKVKKTKRKVEINCINNALIGMHCYSLCINSITFVFPVVITWMTSIKQNSSHTFPGLYFL